MVAAALAAASLVCAANVQAQAPSPPPDTAQSHMEMAPANPFYIGFDVGGTIMNDLKVNNGLGGTMTMDPGARGSFILGYNFYHPWSVEFETAGLWNRVKTISNIPIGEFGNNRADLFQAPFLANLVYCVPLKGGFCWYAGAGCGGVAAMLTLTEDSNFFGNEHHRDTDFTFAYQAKTGIKYCVTPDFEVGLGYKFLGTLGYDWFGSDWNPVSFDNGLNTGKSYTHSFLVSFDWRF